jgi:hypothetical protein
LCKHVESGPFTITLRDQVEMEGVARVVARNMVLGICFAASGAIAAYVFWLKLRPDKSLSRTVER